MKLLLTTTLLFVLQLLLCYKAEAQNSKLKIEKVPAWVTVHNLDFSGKKLEQDAEDGYIDLDFEKQVSLLQQERYIKKTIKILSEAGVQNSSEISVSFDPTYEQLIFHTITIIRDNDSINKLRLSDFKIIQQEKELDRHTYDGSLTALIVLDDVRKGDIIEYSYTVKGFNPIFNNKYTDVYDCNYNVPVCNLYYKLIVPEHRNIIVKNRNINIDPVVTNANGSTIYEWRASNVLSVHPESKLPGWYDPYASIMISEFQNWNEVNNWAVMLFPKNIKVSSGLNKKINSIKELSHNDEERVLSALRFVQDDIRYMAIEIGVNSHKPSHPDKIFTQRYGDCKDKSYLLMTILNAMGIEANPVLINTTAKNAIKDWLPSPSAFDHCTVQVKLNNKVYYFDPTISFQRGNINDIAYPDYQTGLVVDKSAEGLANIPFHEQGLNVIKEIFSIPDKSGSAQLKVVTTYTGSFADDIRFDFNNSSLSEIKNKYKDFYAPHFDKIIADSLTYNDDMTGTFTTNEYYTINNIWKTEDGKNKISVSSYVIDAIMSKPADKNRTMPFYLVYPAHYKEQVEINMPEEWPINGFNDRVECNNFKLTADGASVGNKVTLNYEYENLKDNVMPGEAASFFSNYDDAYKDIGYDLYYDTPQTTPGSSHVAPSVTLGLFPKLYMTLGACVLITFLIRRRKASR